MQLKIRTLKLFFVFDDEDWQEISDELKLRFPNAVYFSRGLKRPMFKYYEEESKHWPIEFTRSLHVLQEKSAPLENVYLIRDPWPEDLASGKALDLIGGWENSFMNPTVEGFHRHGRCVDMHRNFRSVGCKKIVDCSDNYGGLAIERLGTLPAAAYGDAECYYDAEFSTFKAPYNACEPALKEFAYETRRIVQSRGTQSVALYNPLTGEVLDPNYRTAKVLIGWNLLKKIFKGKIPYLMMRSVYDEGDRHPKRDGIAGLIGPRPNHPRVRKWASDRRDL